jgi:hypothetical protein
LILFKGERDGKMISFWEVVYWRKRGNGKLYLCCPTPTAMIDPIDAPEVESEEINPWVDIWVHPQTTIEWVSKNSAPWIPWALLYAGAVKRGVEKALSSGSDEMGDMLLKAFLVSGVGGLIVYLVVLGAIHFCSTWFGGNGTFGKTLTASGWSMVPMLASLFLAMIGFLVFVDSDIEAGVMKYAYWGYGAVQLVLGLWSIVLWVATVAQVQQYSIGRSIASMLCATLLIVGPFIALTILSGGTFSINF